MFHAATPNSTPSIDSSPTNALLTFPYTNCSLTLIFVRERQGYGISCVMRLQLVYAMHAKLLLKPQKAQHLTPPCALAAKMSVRVIPRFIHCAFQCPLVLKHAEHGSHNTHQTCRAGDVDGVGGAGGGRR